MKTLFADTYYYLALVNNRDDGHERATEFAKAFDGKTVTTEWVLAEVADALASPHRRQRFLSLLELLIDDLNVSIVPATHELFEQGIALYSKRADKAWSLTDCISFVVMEDHGLTQALTADRHFEQAGFAIVLG